MSERGGSVGKGHKFRFSRTQEAGRRKQNAGNRPQEMVERAGANEVSGVFSESSRCGTPLKKKKRPTF